jgi:hypothetical protein
MKISVFLSVAGEEGVKAAEILKKELEIYPGPNGIQFKCFLYTEEVSVGEGLKKYCCNEIEKANFFVPILTPEYSRLTVHTHVDTELTNALAREDSVRKASRGRFWFVFPYAPKNGDQIIERIPRLRGRIFTDDAKKLAKSMIKNSPFVLLMEEDYSFKKDWPNHFFNEYGEPDVLLVLGHSGKEIPPTEEEIKNLKICAIEEDLVSRYDSDLLDGANPILPTQSMRIAEFLPKIIRFISNKYLERKNKRCELPEIKSDIDWHLIKYRQELLASHNLICFGAGDTNWISRAVLAYYGTLLPVAFDGPGGSHVIHYKSSWKVETNNANEDVSGTLKIGALSKSIMQVPLNKRHFSAVVLLLPNPWNPSKRVIIAAGLTALGSQAAILALCSSRILSTPQGNVPWARVIRGEEGTDENAWQAVDFEVIA